VYLYVPSYVFICTVVCIQYTHHAVSWMMLPPTSCVRDTSKIHINTFINTCSFMYQGGGGDSHQWAARCFLYRYTRTAASGEGTQTSHVSMCIVQYRETSIQPHVLNTEHMKAPGACKTIPDRYMTTHRLNTQRYKTSECLKYNGCISDKIHRRDNQKGENTRFWGVSVPFSGENGP
jgi:hypothetical protein